MWTSYGSTPFEAIAMNKMVLIAEDTGAKELLANHPLVRISKPNIEDLTKNLRDMLKQNNKGVVNAISLPTWNDYFSKIEEIIIDIHT